MLGLVPADTLPEGRLCVLLGCDVPVVLRPHKKQWEFIGEVYVQGQGVMDGDAMNRSPDFEDFTLI